jgi:ligand-binding sensor domain-containing protein
MQQCCQRGPGFEERRLQQVRFRLSADLLRLQSSRRNHDAVSSPMPQRTFKLDSMKCLLALLILLSCGRQAEAISPYLTLQQLDHSSWTIQSGVPSGINAMEQTSDGWIWLGTTTGLYRFDGVTFELYHPSHGQKILKTGITSLYATREGGLWIGYQRGEASLIENGNIHDYLYKTDKVPKGTIISFLEDQDGSVWAAAADGLGHFSGGNWQRIGANMNFDSPEASYLFQDRAGTLWITTTNHVYFLFKGAREFVRSSYKTTEYAQCAQAPDGTVWIEDPVGLVPLTPKMPKSFTPKALLLAVKDSNGLYFDRDGTLWEFPLHSGVRRLSYPSAVATTPIENRAASVQHFMHADGLTSDLMSAFFEDHEGNIWVATSRGLDRFRATAFTPAPIPPSLESFALAVAPKGAILIGSGDRSLGLLEGTSFQQMKGMPPGLVTTLYSAHGGRIWVGGQGRVGYLQGNRYVPLAMPPDVAKDLGSLETQSITTGPHGDLWIAIGRRAITRIHNGIWKPDERLGNQIGSPHTLMTDHSGLVWAGYKKNVISIHDGNQVRLLNAKQGLNVGDVTALHEAGSLIWVGGEHGLNLFENGKFVTMNFAVQSAVTEITGIALADNGTLWLNAASGLFCISKQEVAAFIKDPRHTVNFETFNYLDGIPGDAGMLYPYPTTVKGTDGRLWFATTGGLVFIDPVQILRNKVMPPVALRSVRADGRPIEAEAGVQLPKGTRSLEIDYTALSFSIPERVHFKYKLEGFDTDWQDVGNRRQAFYTNIPPRHYVFRVIACNNDGLWNTTGITMPINLPATFVQGWYFKILCLALGAAALWWLYRLRISQIEVGIRVRLYERLAERERIARDLHDTFFQGIQGLLLSFNLGTSRLAKDDPVRALFEESLTLSDQVMLEGRKLVLDLRTRISEVTEIENDLSAVAYELAKVYPAQFALTVTGSPRRLDAVVAEEIYKVGREALYNAFRHASATNIEVEVTYAPNEMRLNFRDDGSGLPEQVLQNCSSDGHFGLPGMAERAEKIGARFSIFSRVGGGTEIEIKISSRLAYRSSPTSKHRSSLR